MQFHNIAYTQCLLPEMYFDEEYIKHHVSTLTAWCKILWVKSEKTTCIAFSNRAPINNHGPVPFKF